MEIVWSRDADRDLARIYDYFRSRSDHAARWFLRRIFANVDLLTILPQLGKVVELGGVEFRQIVVEHYQIFYELVGDTRIVIVRLWDSRQDPSELLGSFRED